MPEKVVSYTEKEHIAVVTLNNPDHGNWVDSFLSQELMEACLRINENPDIYFGIITGKGDNFCTGSQLENLLASGLSLSAALAKMNGEAVRYEVAAAVAMIEKPVIAAINGAALGQGLEIALSCDIRYASEKACFGFPQVAAGLMPMDGGTQRLPRLIGKGKALELILSGETIDAREAWNIGLVSQVISADELMAKTTAFATGMAANAPVAMRYVKEAVNKGCDLTLEQGMRLEADLYFLIHTTADRTEGIRAFQEKRKPQFKGE